MPEKLQFFVLDISTRTINNRPTILLSGRTSDNKQILVLDDTFEPYFYVIPKNDEVKPKLEKIKVEKREGELAEVTRVELIEKNILGKEIKALKVYTKLPEDIANIRDVIKEWDIIDKITEYDLPFQRRYLIDKKITPMALAEADGDFINYRSRSPVFKAKKVMQSTDDTIVPKILALDIETYYPSPGEIDFEKNPIIMIALYGHNFKKMITWKTFRSEENIEFVGSESALIESFKSTIEQYRPDILVGYNSDRFDLPYIAARAKKYKINLDLGIDFSELAVNRRSTNISSKIFGILHVDIYRFISKIMAGQLDTELYSLNEVAHELIGEDKLDVDIDQLAELWDIQSSRLDEFAKYNMHDAYLAYRLTQKLLPIMIEMVKIVGLTAYDICRMGFSQLVEWFLLKNESDFNEIAPVLPDHDEIRSRRMQTYTGGFVYEPKPGIYKDIMVFDFRSLYPSIISSHNIAPSTIFCSCCPNELAPTKEKYWFCKKKKGFIPTMMEDLIKRRMRVREIMNKESNTLLEARLQSLKIMANAFYGYLGFYAARWYCLECVKSITAYGRQYIKDVIDKVQKEGFNVIYSDTDSVFFTLEGRKRIDAENFLEEINLGLPGVMELESEGFYPNGIFVSAKSSPSGAKKKYALLSEKGEVKIRGFETVRRNSSKIAKKVQEKVINIILKESNIQKALEYVDKTINDIHDKKISNKDLIIHTQIQKDISEYGTITPYVAVAIKMQEKGLHVGPGTMIRYIVTQGKEKIRDKAKIPEEVDQGSYDPDYYIKNQIIPAVENIFEVLGYSKEELLAGEGQKKLGKFL